MRALLMLIAVALVGAGYFFLMPSSAPPAGSAPIRAGDTAPATPTPTEGSAVLDGVDGPATTLAGAAAALRQVAPDTASPAEAPVARAASAPATVTGRVLDDLGRPLEGADVSLAVTDGLFSRVGLAGTDGAKSDSRSSVVTDAEGRFELTLSVAGDRRMRFGADGYEWLSRQVAVVPGAQTDLGDVQLAAGVRLSGRVVDARGNAVAGARVARPRDSDGSLIIVGLEEPGDVLAETGADGTFEILRHPAGPWKLSANHDRFPRGEASGDALRAGERRDGILIELPDGVNIAGLVAGLPADTKGLIVRARPAQRDLGLGSIQINGLDDFGGGGRTGKLAADGSFEVAGLPPAESYRVALYERAGGPFGGNRRSAAVTAAAGARDVRLVHSEGASVSFRVGDAVTKAPVERFEIASGFGWIMPVDTAAGAATKDHPGGLARIESLWPDGQSSNFQVQVSAIGYDAFLRKGIELAAGATMDLGVFELSPRPVIEVSVTDDAGTPIEGARVVLSELRPEAASSGGTRSFSVTRRIEASSDGGPDSDSVSFGGDLGREEGRTDRDGFAVLNSLPGKRARLVVTAPRFAEWTSEPLQLPLTGPSRHDVALTVGGVVVVTVVDRAGKPAAGVKVERRAPAGVSAFDVPESGDAPRTLVTDAAGTARFDHVGVGAQAFRIPPKAPAGGFMLSFGDSDDSDADSWTSVQVVELGEHALELALPATSTLVGTVFEDGRPLGGAKVRKVENAGMPGAITGGFGFIGGGGGGVATDGAGRFTLADLEPGRVTVEVRHPTRAMPMRFVLELAEGDNVERLELPVSILEGRVEDAHGAPVVGAVVSAKPEGEADGPRSMAVMVFRTSSGDDDGDESVAISGLDDSTVEALTDEDGRYVLRGVTPDIELVVEAKKKGYRDAKSEAMHVAPGAVRSKVDLVLESGGTLEVRCDEPGSWMALAHFEGEDAKPGPPKVAVLKDGVCTFKDLAAGPWRVEVRAVTSTGDQAGFDEQTVNIVSDETATLTFER
ncbi:MAG: carboxypeptidase-like regulatory domain-containing protein [Planctomycetota bacterium]